MTDAEVFLELQMAGGEELGHRPGQFVQLSKFGFGEAPFSVCSSPTRTGRFDLCVREVGNLTGAIHRLEVGEWVGIRGPFGKGFPVNEIKGRNVLAVAGGLGIVPLRSLIAFVADHRELCKRFVVIYGTKSPSVILFGDEMAQWEQAGLETVVTVDEPDETWRGRTGLITEPLREMKVDPANTVVILVGPPVMFRFAIAECLDKGFSEDAIFVSLERNFQCGIGKCGHCQINDLYVCQCGPVFCLTELQGRTEAIETWAPGKDED
jgi:NAD(P)H-flavin reductase